MSESTTAWQALIDEWLAREQRIYSSTPVKSDSVRVRDAVEHDDSVYVLVSFDIDAPWPQEEDAPGDSRSENTAVIHAQRVRQPWVERDATRALAQYATADAVIRINAHPLGIRQAYAGQCAEVSADEVVLEFDADRTTTAQVVDGWFLAVVPEHWRLLSVRALAAGKSVHHATIIEDQVGGEMIEGTEFARTAGRSLYFSPLDLRSVVPVLRWERSGSVVVVAACLEQYDEGGILRLRIDGIRRDDDIFVSWPEVSLESDGQPVPSAVYGEFGTADTASVDIGFQPWSTAVASNLTVHVAGLRGADGPVAPIVLELDAAALRGKASE